MRKPSTTLFYAQTARQLSRHAFAAGVASYESALDAFCRHQLRQDHILCPGTVLVYRQAIKRVCKTFAKKGVDVDRVAVAQERMLTWLNERSGTPDEDRTSRLKITMPRYSDIRKTRDRLAARVLKRARSAQANAKLVTRPKDRREIVLLLYLLCAPRLGIRPIELIGMRRQGHVCIVQTAKLTGNPERSIPLLGWGPEDLVALDLLICLTSNAIDTGDFVAWRNALASMLARASLAACKKRISLYFGRHVAVARWRELGLSMEQIRLLAGHLGLKSQMGYGQGAGGIIVHWVTEDERRAAAVFIAEHWQPAPDKSGTPDVGDAVSATAAEAERFFGEAATRKPVAEPSGAELWEKFEKERDAHGGVPARFQKQSPARERPDKGFKGGV
ncbi:site-specific integrase [Pelagibacterium luteolum]|uniref:Tyr recombinase domain-containing protein n=1 Tax=Pelagibacterium luteolum TaxID=440168 RepID=A0A1G7XWY7_9HYPH|nr:site-specific integrase [Pelagibacterium luteolum]SDG88536.1 hypothetical protein SAMN04487974_11145 [Pelagibacterium luteolum]